MILLMKRGTEKSTENKNTTNQMREENQNTNTYTYTHTRRPEISERNYSVYRTNVKMREEKVKAFRPMQRITISHHTEIWMR